MEKELHYKFFGWIYYNFSWNNQNSDWCVHFQSEIFPGIGIKNHFNRIRFFSLIFVIYINKFFPFIIIIIIIIIYFYFTLTINFI